MTQEKANFYYFALVHITALSLAMSGCATQSKSIGLGGAIGAGTGAVLGGIADPGKDGEYRTRNVVVGAALGGMAGMMTASLVHENTEKQKEEAFRKGQAPSVPPKAGNMPNLKNPQVETHWVEGKVVGNRYIEGHFEYVIVQPARWDESQ